jgi:hypothetical protein
MASVKSLIFLKTHCHAKMAPDNRFNDTSDVHDGVRKLAPAGGMRRGRPRRAQ